MKIIKNVYNLVLLAIILVFTIAAPAFADTINPASAPGMRNYQNNERGKAPRSREEMMRPMIFGTVTAINGNSITITEKLRPNSDTTTLTYTIDATNAKIMKNGTAGTIASILVGDVISAQGVLTGTNLVATNIRDGFAGARSSGNEGEMNKKGANGVANTPVFAGNGQPVVAGAVTAINGSVITITNKSNVSYTIDASSAKIKEGKNAITISNIAVGDMLIVQGSVNGNVVTAATVIDQPAITTSTNSGNQEKSGGGFLGGIGSFFSHLFGF